jgi:hypothetical protein
MGAGRIRTSASHLLRSIHDPAGTILCVLVS